MRKILSPEQVAQVVADITGWMAHLAEVAPNDKAKQDWQEATIHSIKQLAGIDEAECYLVVLTFPTKDKSSYIVPFLLTRQANGSMASLVEYTFFPPDYSHPTQAREHKTAIQIQQSYIDDDEIYC